MNPERFWLKVNRTGGCWLWTAAVSTGGYGRVHWDGKLRQAHRVAYELEVGPIPEGLELDHLCRVRRCVRPDHLEPVSGKVNKLRGVSPSADHARKTHCDAGHPLEGPGADVYTRNGWRYCRPCRLAAALKYQRRKRAEKLVTTTCVACGKDFTYNGKRRTLCSDECRKDRQRQVARDFQRAKRQAAH